MILLAISRESLYISGGVLLFLISVGMIFPNHGHLGGSATRTPKASRSSCRWRFP